MESRVADIIMLEKHVELNDVDRKVTQVEYARVDELAPDSAEVLGELSRYR